MLKTNPIYNRDLARIFSTSVLKDLAIQGESPVLNAVRKRIFASNPYLSNLSLLELYDNVYQYLCKEYRIEYVYKNMILQQILIKRHNVDESTMITEFRAGNSIVDALILNSTSTAYEIKTEYDNLNRLDEQVKSYQKLFDEIYIVTYPGLIAPIIEKVPDSVGLIVLNNENKLITSRNAGSNKSNIDSVEFLYSLRQNEYLQIAHEILECDLDSQDYNIFNFVKKIFLSTDPERIHDLAVEILKKRTDPYLKEVILGIPDPIKLSFWESKLPRKHKKSLKTQFEG